MDQLLHEMKVQERELDKQDKELSILKERNHDLTQNDLKVFKIIVDIFITDFTAFMVDI